MVSFMKRATVFEGDVAFSVETEAYFQPLCASISPKRLYAREELDRCADAGVQCQDPSAHSRSRSCKPWPSPVLPQLRFNAQTWTTVLGSLPIESRPSASAEQILQSP